MNIRQQCKFKTRVILLSLSLVFLLPLFFPKIIHAAWFFPMDKYYERQTIKGFGQYIDDNFYKGKEGLFPYNRFYGYHAAVDLEINPDELDEKVPVYAISSGTITYIGSLSGYGGVILEKLDNDNSTVIFGHVKISNLPFKVGDQITVENNPIVLTYLGNNFSSETSKERKHLHFGIFKGSDLYFKGHENSISELEIRWFDPSIYLSERNAIDPETNPSSTITNSPISSLLIEKQEKNGLIFSIISLINKLFNLF